MKKDVLISIRGIQRIDDDKEETELFTHGNYYHRENEYYIIYEESGATGYDGSRITLRINEAGNKVTLVRSGSARSHLVIESGCRNIGHYGTTEGELVIGVNTRMIDSRLTDQGGDLHFSYSLDINSSLVSENEVYIKVKENNENGVGANG